MKLLSCVRLFVAPWTCSPPGSSIHEFSRQEYWSGLPFPFPAIPQVPGNVPPKYLQTWISHEQRDKSLEMRKGGKQRHINRYKDRKLRGFLLIASNPSVLQQHGHLREKGRIESSSDTLETLHYETKIRGGIEKAANWYQKFSWGWRQHNDTKIQWYNFLLPC